MPGDEAYSQSGKRNFLKDKNKLWGMMNVFIILIVVMVSLVYA